MVAKYGLALHTSTPELGLAINQVKGEGFDDEKLDGEKLDGEKILLLRSQVWNLQREVSNLLHQYLIDFIQPQTWQDLGFIAVAAGPGGFTGTRIGVVAARTFGQQLQIPVFAISTLAAFAWQSSQKDIHKQDISDLENHKKTNSNNNSSTINIAVQMPAQRGQLFAAIYQINLQKQEKNQQINPLLPDTVFTPTAWQDYLANFHDSYYLVEALSGLAATVPSILELASYQYLTGQRPDWSQALPFYGQNPV